MEDSEDNPGKGAIRLILKRGSETSQTPSKVNPRSHASRPLYTRVEGKDMQETQAHSGPCVAFHEEIHSYRQTETSGMSARLTKTFIVVPCVASHMRSVRSLEDEKRTSPACLRTCGSPPKIVFSFSRNRVSSCGQREGDSPTRRHF